jgi:hypothetical protein
MSAIVMRVVLMVVVTKAKRGERRKGKESRNVDINGRNKN